MCPHLINSHCCSSPTSIELKELQSIDIEAVRCVQMIAKYYRDRDGSQPVAEFIDALPIKAQVLLHNQIERLDLCTVDGPPLPYPYSSQVRGELRELRCHVGTKLYRVLYRRSEQFFVLLHIFQKNTKKVPESEISIAETRWDDFKVRMDESPRRAPRPIGRDAP